ncbi:MAG: hypothetical protein JWM28_3273 [Chitinophagaceae bacterium]|nr:hypothetical protein [Chitinophagaceae bacterium]
MLAIISVTSCKKQTETFITDTGSDYIPLQTGKYIVYRLDSTVFLNFGKIEQTHAYQVKFEVNAEVQDNLGRPAYRIFRYTRDSAGTQSWQPDNTYLITPLDNQVEFTDDNLRFIKLHLPIKDGYSWKGNKYLPDDPYSFYFLFSNDDAMADWDYYYNGDPEPSVTLEGQSYTDVLTVQEDDESYNVPVIDQSSYAARTYSIEKYSKNIGLVYKELILWEQQPNPTLVDPGDPNDPINYPPVYSYDPFKTGFGIKMWMIDHN